MQEQLTIWNDEADLLRRAAPPRVEWFPVPRRAAAMQPLVWLLALIPILFVAVSSPWNEVAARWGLRSLKLVSAETWSEFVDPGDIVPDGPLTYEAPLVTWCTAAAIWISGSSQPLAVIFPSAVCVYLLVIVGYELARAVGGPWMGMLTAILLATHPISQQLVQQPTSVTMGLVLALMTLWCLLRHLSSVPGVWSLWLLFGGIAWGLCLLSNGPLAISCVMIVAMFQATAPRYGTSSRRIIPLNRKADGVDWKRWKSLLLWFAIGAVAGGWWPLMMGSVHGPDFWTMWLGLIGKAPALQPVSVEPESWIDGSKVWFRQSAAFLPLLSGFLVLGAYRLIRIVCLNEEPAQRRPQHFLLVLTLFAVTMWVMSMMGYESGLFQRSLWNAFLLVPLAMLAAGGLQEIGERQAGFGVTLAAYGFGVLVAIWRYRGLWLDPSK